MRLRHWRATCRLPGADLAIRALFFGRLQDIAGGPERELPARSSVSELVAALEPALAAALRSDKVRVAINGEVGVTAVADGDEVAFLPPVSGG